MCCQLQSPGGVAPVPGQAAVTEAQVMTPKDYSFILFKIFIVTGINCRALLCVHRMVNTCLVEELKEIHAFEQKTLTPEQWEKQNSQ